MGNYWNSNVGAEQQNGQDVYTLVNPFAGQFAYKCSGEGEYHRSNQSPHQSSLHILMRAEAHGRLRPESVTVTVAGRGYEGSRVMRPTIRFRHSSLAGNAPEEPNNHYDEKQDRR